MLTGTIDILQQGIAENLHIGARVFAAIDGREVANEAVGLARLAADCPTGRDVPMTTDTLMLFLSAGKPITGIFG